MPSVATVEGRKNQTNAGSATGDKIFAPASGGSRPLPAKQKINGFHTHHHLLLLVKHLDP
jgi:hypothetical protein